MEKDSFKKMWLISTIVIAFLSLCFILATTAFFKRSVDRGVNMAGGIYFYILWFPVVIYTIISFVCMLLNKIPKPVPARGAIILINIFIYLTLIPVLAGGIETKGWLTEYVASEPIHGSSDGKYEYALRMINTFQKDALMVIDIWEAKTGEENRIIVLDNAEASKIRGYSLGPHWTRMTATDKPNIYLIETVDTSCPIDGSMMVDVATMSILELNERPHSESLQISDDGKYEHAMQMFNPSQKSRYIALYVRELETGKEHLITLDIDITNFDPFDLGFNHSQWTTMAATENPQIYSIQTANTQLQSYLNPVIFNITLNAETMTVLELKYKR